MITISMGQLCLGLRMSLYSDEGSGNSIMSMPSPGHESRLSVVLTVGLGGYGA